MISLTSAQIAELREIGVTLDQLGRADHSIQVTDRFIKPLSCSVLSTDHHLDQVDTAKKKLHCGEETA